MRLKVSSVWEVFGRRMFDFRASAELASAGFSILWMTSESSGGFPYCFNGRICCRFEDCLSEASYRRSGIIGSPPENN